MSTSPPLEGCSPRTSVTYEDVGDIVASLETSREDIFNHSVTDEAESTPASADTTSTEDISNFSVMEESGFPVPEDITPVVQNEEPPEPPRRRYQRRSSATAYNLHNYSQQAQSCQGEMTHNG
jgi:hypothetical protein